MSVGRERSGRYRHEPKQQDDTPARIAPQARDGQFRPSRARPAFQGQHTHEIRRPLTHCTTHRGLEITAVIADEPECYWMGQRTALKPGDCFFTNCLLPHYTGNRAGGTHRSVCAHFSAEALCRIPHAHSARQLLELFPLRSRAQFPVVRRCADIVDHLCKAAEAQAEERHVAAWASLLCGLELLRRRRQEQTRQEAPCREIPVRDFLLEALLYVQQHFREPLTVRQVAAHCNTGASHLAHSFSRAFGTPLLALRNSLRVDEALQKIMTTGGKIETVAGECGFPSIGHFNRLFRRQTGRNPSFFRHRA